MVKIALDYDGTYTADPEFWNKFIDECQRKDYLIQIVTFRSEDMPIDHELPIPVYYTGFMQKREYMLRQGIHIDIWIDDSPEAIPSIADMEPYRDTDRMTQERERWKAVHEERKANLG